MYISRFRLKVKTTPSVNKERAGLLESSAHVPASESSLQRRGEIHLCYQTSQYKTTPRHPTRVSTLYRGDTNATRMIT